MVDILDRDDTRQSTVGLDCLDALGLNARPGSRIYRAAATKSSLVCQAWTLDWRCKSSAEQVGSNRKPKATARRTGRRETIRPGAARPCGEEAGGALQHRT